MTRPDIERIRAVFDRPGDPTNVLVIADLCRYALALEAARDAVIGACQTAEGPCDGPHPCPRCRFDAAVARWMP